MTARARAPFCAKRATSSRMVLLLSALCWLSAGGGTLGAAGRPERAARDGLAAYRSGDYAAAAEAFGAAAELRPGVPELLYDAGVSAYRLGDYAAAQALLQPALDNASGPELAAAGHLALGNIRMREAQQLLQQNPAAAVPALESGIASFERALRVSPAYPAAAHNLELARVMLDELRRQQPPPQQDSGGQEPSPQQEQQDGEHPPSDPQDHESEAPPPAGSEDNQTAQAPDAGVEESGDTPPEQDPDLLARQIIAAEEANAELRRHRQSRLQPVPRDW